MVKTWSIEGNSFSEHNACGEDTGYEAKDTDWFFHEKWYENTNRQKVKDELKVVIQKTITQLEELKAKYKLDKWEVEWVISFGWNEGETGESASIIFNDNGITIENTIEHTQLVSCIGYLLF